ncbi:hypothetical protein KCU76_g38, partial [Aureobasidium melanogenum]
MLRFSLGGVAQQFDVGGCRPTVARARSGRGWANGPMRIRMIDLMRWVCVVDHGNKNFWSGREGEKKISWLWGCTPYNRLVTRYNFILASKHRRSRGCVPALSFQTRQRQTIKATPEQLLQCGFIRSDAQCISSWPVLIYDTRIGVCFCHDCRADRWDLEKEQEPQILNHHCAFLVVRTHPHSTDRSVVYPCVTRSCASPTRFDLVATRASGVFGRRLFDITFMPRTAYEEAYDMSRDMSSRGFWQKRVSKCEIQSKATAIRHDPADSDTIFTTDRETAS